MDFGLLCWCFSPFHFRFQLDIGTTAAAAAAAAAATCHDADNTVQYYIGITHTHTGVFYRDNLGEENMELWESVRESRCGMELFFWVVPPRKTTFSSVSTEAPPSLSSCSSTGHLSRRRFENTDDCASGLGLCASHLLHLFFFRLVDCYNNRFYCFALLFRWQIPHIANFSCIQKLDQHETTSFRSFS